MANIKDKIAKLLALADSPNANEARAALLKARELMAAHKLRPEECTRSDAAEVVRELSGINYEYCDWVAPLAAVIAEGYCCKAYGAAGQIGFVGLADDVAVCLRIFRYAHDCVDCGIYEEEERSRTRYGRRGSEGLGNAYGAGFVRGLRDAFQKQNEKGLVLVTPPPVAQAVKDWRREKAAPPTPDQVAANRYGWRGYREGAKFNPANKLGTGVA